MDESSIQRIAGESLQPIASIASTLTSEERLMYWNKIAIMILSSGYIMAGEIKNNGVFNADDANKWLKIVTDTAKNDTKWILEHPEMR
jgi:hypothetical protein